MKKKSVISGREKHSVLSGEFWVTSWRPYLVLVVAALIVFGRTIYFQFTFFDDNRLIVDGFTSLSKSSAWVDAFSTKYLGMYFRPVVSLSLILDAQFGGIAPKVYHVANVCYHCIASCLVFLVLTQLGLKRIPAFLASIFFAVHPLTTQAVAWVLGRNDTLLAVFGLLSFSLLLSYESKDKLPFFILHIITFFLALLTKESSVVLPILALYYLLYIRHIPLMSKKIIVYIGGWAATGLAWYWLRSRVMTDGDAPLSINAFIANLQVPLEMLGKMAIPIGYSTYPTFSVTVFATGVVILILCTVLLLVNRKENSMLGLLGLLWMVLFIVPSLAVHLTDSRHKFNYLECRAYAPLFGFTLILASLLPELIKKFPSVVRKSVLIFIPLFGFVAVNYSMSYKDAEAHWQRAIVSSPNAADTYFVMGIVYLKEKNNPVKAIENFEKAVALDPNNFEYHDNLGTVYGQQGNLEKAEEQFKRAIELETTHPFPFTNLAYLYILKREYSQAMDCLLKAYAIDSTFQKTHEMLAVLYRREKEYGKMIYFVEKMEKEGAHIDPKLKHLADSLRSK